MQQLITVVLLALYLFALTASTTVNDDSLRSSTTLTKKVPHTEKPLISKKQTRNLKSSSKTTTSSSKTITPAAADDDDAGSTNILTSNANTSGTGWVGLQAITAFFVIIAAVAFALFLRPTTNRSQYQPL
jgi:hypothetical protein